MNRSMPTRRRLLATACRRIIAWPLAAALVAGTASGVSASTRVDDGNVSRVAPAVANPVVPRANLELQGLLEAELGRTDPDAGQTAFTATRLEAVSTFYEARAFEPVWVRAGALTDVAAALIARLGAAEADGLEASAYALPDDLNEAKRDLDAGTAARLERAISVLLVLYADHAQAGRVQPSSLSKFITAKPERPDPVAVLTALAASTDPVADLDAFNPPHDGFQALRRKLAELTDPAMRDMRPPVVPEGKVLKQGVRDERVALLRMRLGLPGNQAADDADATGSLASQAQPRDTGSSTANASSDPEESADGGHEAVADVGMATGSLSASAAGPAVDLPQADPVDATLFDAGVKEAVLAFQEENGLHADGIVGPRTLLALNAVADDAMAVSDVIANMERWRWLPRDLGPFHVKVSIPEFKVRIVREGDVVHETRVVVGKPSNQTPVFSDEIDHVIVNPYWNVPYSIASQELLPSIQANPTGYMARKNYEVLAGGRVISPTSVDWASVNLRSVRIRQRPGPGNALGKIKFMFPNKHAVYLHDTPSKRLFGRSSRAFSHGCVRVHNPFDFADALFQLDPQWDADALKDLFGPKERRVNMKRTVPVHLTYFTAHVDANGRLQRRPDIYGHNARLTKALDIEGWQEWQRFAVVIPPKRQRARVQPARVEQRKVLSVREQRAKTFRLRQRGSNDLYR